MKTLLFLMAVSLGGCTMERQVQVRMVDVELVKVETIFRQPNQQEKVLTWQDENNIQYISYEPANSAVNIGSRMKMLVRR
jgi:hypothetical protein